jgi:hypothetical protein
MPKEKKDQPTHSKQEPPTTANGLEASETATVNKNGPTALSTTDTGKTTEPTAKESSSTLTATSMMVIGWMIKLMDMVSITISMAPCTKAIGEMISNTVKAKKAGLMALFTKDFIWLERSMEWDYTAGMMEASIMENGLKIRLKGMVPIVGWMEDNIKGNGLITIWMEWVFILGPMVDAIWVNTKTIRNMDMVFTSGLMADSILVNGWEANNMDLEFTKQLKPISNMVFGKKENVLNGMMSRQ